MGKTDGESNGKDVGATSKAQQKKCENPTSNTGSADDVKQANTGKNGNVVEPGKENKAEMMKKDVESDGDEDGVTTEAQKQKCEKPTLDAQMATMMAMLAEMRAIDIEKEEREELNRKKKDDGEDDGVSREAQQQQHGTLMVTQQQRYDASMATMATMMPKPAEITGADNTAEKGIKETTEKEKKEEREESYRKEKKERGRRKRGIVLERRKRIERGISQNFI